jgi:hypothetical protein
MEEAAVRANTARVDMVLVDWPTFIIEDAELEAARVDNNVVFFMILVVFLCVFL